MADGIAAGADPRAERYWQLLATVNGWPAIPSRQEEVQFLLAALRVS